MLCITLTTPWDPGSANPGVSYDSGFLAEIRLDRVGVPRIGIIYMLGTISGGEPVPGPGGPTQRHDILGAEATTIMDAVSAAASEVYVDELERGILQWLIDNGHTAGTIGLIT